MSVICHQIFINHFVALGLLLEASAQEISVQESRPLSHQLLAWLPVKNCVRGSSMSPQKNSFHALRERRLAEATREYTARGNSAKRCEYCLLATYACVCEWLPQLQTQADFVLVMHRNEVFKPTNTGRLIADLFPQNSHAFCWSRTEPDEELLALLHDPERQCYIVFPEAPARTAATPRNIVSAIPASTKRITFILLDGTWKQSGRMFHLSRWMEQVPCVSLPEGLLRGYAMRKSHQEDYLSTAEAAALCLQLSGDHTNSEALLLYFQLFNQHYLATRGTYVPAITPLHHQLRALNPA